MKKIIWLITLIFSSSICSNAATVSFEVKENSGVSRTNDTVIYGVPFSEAENVTSTSNITMGRDAVYTVLSRYNGTPSDGTKPIRSLLVSFQDSFTANQTKTYALSTTGGSGSMSGPNLATDNTGYVEIATGAGTFRISKTEGNLFDYAAVGSDVVINEPTGDGLSVIMGGITYSSTYSAPTITIEANNPLYAVIKVTGRLEDSSHNAAVPPAANGFTPDSPLRYMVRHYFYKNKSYVRSFISLRNENKAWGYTSETGAHNAYITSASIQTTANGVTGTKTVEIESYSDSYTIGSYSVQQYENSASTSTAYDWQYKINGGANIAGKYNGGLSVKDSSKGLFIADRWFWENHPNKLSVTDNVINADIFPSTGSNIRLLAGSYKTHEMLYYFHNGDTSFNDEIAFLRDRPVIRCLNDRYWQTAFLPGMLPASPTLKDDVTFGSLESLQTAFTRYKNDARAKFDSSFVSSGETANKSIPDHMAVKSVQSTGTPTYFTWYGWQYFGGMPRASGFGYSNQHYDWGSLAQLDFLQYGNYASKNISEALLNHKIDYLVMHDPDATTIGTLDYEYHGGQRYEEDALFTTGADYYHYSGNNSGARGMSHFWTKDLTIAYLTTGDMRYMDAINESLLHVSRVGASSTTTGVETRHQYRGIDALLHGYMVTGDVSKLSSAYSMFSENILVREGGNCTGTYLYAKDCTGDGVSGWLQSGSSVGSVWVNYDTIGVEPTVKLYKTLADAGMEVEAATVRGFILRWAGWIKDTVFGAYGFGVYSSGDTLYVPYSVSINVTGATGLSVNSTWDSAYAATYADVLYLAWELSGDSSFKNTAIAVWKDYQYYYTSGAVSQGSPVTSVDSPSNARALYQNYSSGDTKVPKIIDKPSYFIGEYLKTNYQGPGKRYRLRAVPIIVHDGL